MKGQLPRFKIKDIDVSSGGPLIVIMSRDDAFKLGIHNGDRVGLIKGKRKVHAIIDVAESDKFVGLGELGLFEEVLSNLHVRAGSYIELKVEPKPASLEYIRNKLNKKRLPAGHIRSIIEDVVHGKLSDIELTYFVAGCAVNGLNEKETIALTKAIIDTGDKIRPKKKIVADKHCTGGVAGNRTTMLVTPIVAAAGIAIPKTSSRAITSPAGTADTMEVLAKVNLPIKQMEKAIEKTNGCIIWGGAVNLAPADDKLIKVRSPMQIDAEPQLLASILGKKKSVGATHVLIDIPVGKETKIKSRREGIKLAKHFIKIGKKLGMHIEYTITNGNEPIGNGIGPALEAKDVLKVLERSDTRPLDLETKSCMLAGKILEMTGKCKVGMGKEMAMKILDDGRALKKMKEIIRAQKGNSKVTSSDIEIGKYTYEFKAQKTGKIKDIENTGIINIARTAGAPIDKEAGIFIYVHEGQTVKRGDILLRIHANSENKLNFAKLRLYKEQPILIR